MLEKQENKQTPRRRQFPCVAAMALFLLAVSKPGWGRFFFLGGFYFFFCAAIFLVVLVSWRLSFACLKPGFSSCSRIRNVQRLADRITKRERKRDPNGHRALSPHLRCSAIRVAVLRRLCGSAGWRRSLQLKKRRRPFLGGCHRL